MECRDAQFYSRLRRPGVDDLDPDVTAALNAHTTGCPACAADIRAAVAFDRALGRAMQSVPVPPALRGQILARTAAAQSTIFRRRLYRAGGLVAAVLLVACIGLGVFSSTRPKVDTDEIVAANDDQITNPEESTRKWLVDQSLPDRLPVDFDYELLNFRGFERVKSRYVPVIQFRSPEGSGFAKVYIFRPDGTYNLKDIQEAQASHTRAQVMVNRGVTYVFVHTGGPQGLRPFLKSGITAWGARARIGNRAI